MSPDTDPGGFLPLPLPSNPSISTTGSRAQHGIPSSEGLRGKEMGLSELGRGSWKRLSETEDSLPSNQRETAG